MRVPSYKQTAVNVIRRLLDDFNLEACTVTVSAFAAYMEFEVYLKSKSRSALSDSEDLLSSTYAQNYGWMVSASCGKEVNNEVGGPVIAELQGLPNLYVSFWTFWYDIYVSETLSSKL